MESSSHIGNHYTGGIGYADDLTLLTPTRSGLKVLIEICEQYADNCFVKFNSAKGMYLVFRGRSCKPDNITVVFNGTSCRVFRMLYIWATVYPLLMRIYVSHGAKHSDSCGDWHLLHTAMSSRCCLIVCHY